MFEGWDEKGCDQRPIEPSVYGTDRLSQTILGSTESRPLTFLAFSEYVVGKTKRTGSVKLSGV